MDDVDMGVSIINDIDKGTQKDSDYTMSHVEYERCMPKYRICGHQDIEVKPMQVWEHMSGTEYLILNTGFYPSGEEAVVYTEYTVEDAPVYIREKSDFLSVIQYDIMRMRIPKFTLARDSAPKNSGEEDK
jgi:hypothetical protein